MVQLRRGDGGSGEASAREYHAHIQEPQQEAHKTAAIIL